MHTLQVPPDQMYRVAAPPFWMPSVFRRHERAFAASLNAHFREDSHCKCPELSTESEIECKAHGDMPMLSTVCAQNSTLPSAAAGLYR